ncbi:uncharacterized protein LOC141647031 [Silene latifolia]|uniref:uncharacterized protein LOC141647031 n=1 Tax=Silene latifolia TaxID=37657 RepID=UPI003D7874FE
MVLKALNSIVFEQFCTNSPMKSCNNILISTSLRWSTWRMQKFRASTAVGEFKLAHSWMWQLLMVYLDLVWRTYQYPAYYLEKVSHPIPSPCVLGVMGSEGLALGTKAVLTSTKLRSM